MNKTKADNLNSHQAWLALAYAAIRNGSGLLPEARESVVVSYSFPRGARRAVGVCYYEPGSVGTDVIMIHPKQWTSAVDVLHVLLHEAIHTTARGAGHRGEFVRLAKRVGLTKPWTATTPSEDLTARLNDVAAQLPTFPQAAFDPKTATGERKGSRLRLFECSCQPKPKKVRAAVDELGATCDDCDAPFLKKEGKTT